MGNTKGGDERSLKANGLQKRLPIGIHQRKTVITIFIIGELQDEEGNLTKFQKPSLKASPLEKFSYSFYSYFSKGRHCIEHKILERPPM